MCLSYLAKYTCSTIQILDRLFLSLYPLWILDYIHLAEEPLQFPWNLHCLSSIKSKSSNSKQFCSSWIFVISLPFPATKITVEWQWRIIFSHEIIYNFYFLIVAIISVALGSTSPVSPVPSILALLFVIFVTMIKQGYEDFLRHRADGAINRKEVTQVGPDSLNTIQSQKFKVKSQK